MTLLSFRLATLLDIAYYIQKACNSLIIDCITNCFVKADIIDELIAFDTGTRVKGVNDIAVLLQNSTIIDQVEVETIDDEIEFVLHTDDENSEKWQQCMLEEIDKIVTNVDNGLTMESDEETDHDEEVASHQIYTQIVDFNTMLTHLGQVYQGLRSKKGQVHVTDNELEQCMDICSELECKIAQVNSNSCSKQFHASKQMTMRDFFK